MSITELFGENNIYQSVDLKQTIDLVNNHDSLLYYFGLEPIKFSFNGREWRRQLIEIVKEIRENVFFEVQSIESEVGILNKGMIEYIKLRHDEIVSIAEFDQYNLDLNEVWKIMRNKKRLIDQPNFSERLSEILENPIYVFADVVKQAIKCSINGTNDQKQMESFLVYYDTFAEILEEYLMRHSDKEFFFIMEITEDGSFMVNGEVLNLMNDNGTNETVNVKDVGKHENEDDTK